MDVRKARKIVMKSEIVSNTTYKTHIKTFAYLIMKKIELKKMLNFRLIVYILKPLELNCIILNMNTLLRFTQCLCNDNYMYVIAEKKMITKIT